jgi:hypothetical protein
VTPTPGLSQAKSLAVINEKGHPDDVISKLLDRPFDLAASGVLMHARYNVKYTALAQY